jgi:transposase
LVNRLLEEEMMIPRKLRAETPCRNTVRDIRRVTRKYLSEEKIRFVLEGLRGEKRVAELCRREGINTNVYYRWTKAFLKAGKKRLSGDTGR